MPNDIVRSASTAPRNADGRTTDLRLPLACWATLADQLERLAAIVADESN
jgi:hypothetical protein